MQNKNARKLALLAAALAIIAAIVGSVVYITQYSDSDTADNETEQTETQEESKTYQIEVTVDSLDDKSNYTVYVQAGETAFNVLEELASNTDFEFTYDEYDFGVMITSMDGITPGSSQFWKFQVNEEDASVGVSDYKIQEGDSLTFVLDEIQF